MRKSLKILLLLALLQTTLVSAQVIRKNYREMTTTEKQIFVNALLTLGPGTTTGTVVNKYAVNHDQLFNLGIHQVDDFLPWHRWFILFFEKELQNTNVTGANKIALPYWDWTSKYYTTSPDDRATTAPLWDNSFLGQFNSSWSLGRNLGSSTLGTTSVLNTTLLNTNFTNFRPGLEINLHNVAHNWVGGVMILRTSPGDPAFFLHHNMVDKIWQDWQNLGRTSSFPDEILPNKGSSSVPNFPSGVPDVSPTSIIDSRASSVKVWYAEDGKVILDKYTVSGTENYHYTGIIEAGSRVIPSVVINSTTVNYSTGSFTVPSGTTCNFVSGGLQMGSATTAGYIRLVPGFTAQAGSNFTAKINSAYFTDASAGGRLASTESDDLSAINLADKVYVYPNPSNGLFNFTLNDNNNQLYSYTVKNSFGKILAKGSSTESNGTIDLTGIERGIYLLIVKMSSGDTVTKRLAVN